MNEFFKTADYWRTTPHPEFKMFSAGHIAIIIAMFVLSALIIAFLRKSNHKNIKLYLKISAIFWVMLEIIKIILFYCLTTSKLQAAREVLPFYMCSLFVFMLPLAAFTGGKIKKVAEYTLSTLCLLGGVLTTINCPALLNYPFLSFFSLHSLIYHATMFLTGILLISSGYIKLNLKKFYLPMISIVILAIPATITNYLVNTDYMLLRYAWGTPILSDIAKKIGQAPQAFLMMFIYLLISFLVTAIIVAITRLVAFRNIRTRNSD